VVDELIQSAKPIKVEIKQEEAKKVEKVIADVFNPPLDSNILNEFPSLDEAFSNKKSVKTPQPLPGDAWMRFNANPTPQPAKKEEPKKEITIWKEQKEEAYPALQPKEKKKKKKKSKREEIVSGGFL
jgi:hypothetical protein